MSFSAFKLMHWATAVENCASGYITHSFSDFAATVPAIQNDDPDSEWDQPPVKARIGPIPNLVISAANVLEVYVIRVQEEDSKASRHSGASSGSKGGGVVAGVSGAWLELVCHYRLHGNVETMAILSAGSDDGRRKRDSIILTFKDAKISVLEYDDSLHGLRTSSMHCFEGPEWQYLKRGRENFARGPLVYVDPQGRCGGVLICDSQMLILKASKFLLAAIVLVLYIAGYIEPVMVILHEKELTWAGRLSWKHHTCMISAFSISTTLKQHPLIWSASNLPHDAYKLLSVPSPIGGVLVICANSIHYHSQSMSCALALNDFVVAGENSQEMPRSNVNVELDAAHATWLSNDVALFSIKTGELLLLTLVYDGRTVQRLELSKSRASVLTSGITTISNHFFFLGSRLGDSLLVQFNSGASQSILTSRQGKDEGVEIEGDAPAAKRLRRASSDVSQDVNEELSLYVSAPAPNNLDPAQQKSFSFAVRDSLLNVGPLKDFSYGLRINADPNASGVAKQSNYELVSCSGHGKNGALCLLQQSIRPELVTEVELTGVKGIWTVYHKNPRSHSTDSSKVAAEGDEFHAYLIISLESRTMVLETADLLGEVTESVDYYVQGSTIVAGNLFGRYVVCHLLSEILFICIADPATCTITSSLPAVFENLSDPITACTFYHDKGPEPWLRKASPDAWLSSGVAEALDGSDASQHDQGDIYCLVCYESGRLEIFDVPSFKCLFSVDRFLTVRTHLFDAHHQESFKDLHKAKSSYSEDSDQLEKEAVKNMKVVELCMHRWSGQYGRPFLFAGLADGSTLCYHAYLYEGQDNMTKLDDSNSAENVVEASNTSTSRLRNLRFIRVSLQSLTREESPGVVSYRKIITFMNIGGHQGAFIAGSRPAWLIVCRERLRIHHQLCDGPIVAFTVLHNVNCNYGCIYVTSQGFLKICRLPSWLNYDNYWPVQKIPLRGTPHQVTYIAEKNLYALILSIPVAKPSSQVLTSLVDHEVSHQSEHDNLNPEDLNRSYFIDEFEVRILEPAKAGGPWETKATIPMQSSEHAITIRLVSLSNTLTKETDTLLAVGTAYVQGEDVAARGRIILYSVGQNADNPQNWVTEVHSKELKGAISALAPLQGHLLIASGPKIVLHKWNGTELTAVAFFDAPLYVVSLNIVKNFILMGDIHKSIYFLSWKEQGAQLSLLAKDFGSLNCYTTEFLIDGSTLSLVVSDDQKNIQIFYYAPKLMESWKGQKLLPKAEFHVGSHVTRLMRLQMLPTSDRTSASSGTDKTNRFALLFGTLDGSIGCIAPLEELTFRRLQMLQRKLVDRVPHACGLNPRAFRQFRSNGKAHKPGPDNMVDCELLCHYEMLPLEEQLDIAHQIGTTRAQIVTNLSDLTLGTSFL
ncbi:hypothetical protein AMTRI_Chr09g42200 [Amborella trichopoda]